MLGKGQKPHITLKRWGNGCVDWKCSSWNGCRVGYGDSIAEAWYRWRYGS